MTTALEHNKAKVLDLAEIMDQYASGIITAYEVLIAAKNIGQTAIVPPRGTIDDNTGLRY